MAIGKSILIPLFIVSLFLMSCIQQTNTNAQEIPTECTQYDNPLEREICITNIAVKNQDISLCSKVGKYERGSCITHVALTAQDAKVCESITKEGDIAIDIFSQDQRENCILLVAKETKNEELCAKIQASDSQKSCIASIQGSYESCKEIEDISSRYYCFVDIAVATKNIQICEEIVSIGVQNTCISGVAAATKDRSLCDRISDSYPKETCLIEVAVKEYE